MPPHDSPAPIDDEQLARRIEDLTPRLLAWVRSKSTGSSRIDPHDLVQETWFRAVSRMDTFDGATDDDFAAWTFGIQKIVFLESRRAAQRGARIRGSDGQTELEAALRNAPAAMTTLTRRLVRNEQHELFQERIAELDPEDRQLFELCALEQVSREEAAERVGSTKAAVTKKWQRLRARLAEAGGPIELLGAG